MSLSFSMTGKSRQKSPRHSTTVQYGPVNKVVLFTNARDEKNIKEWAAYHLLLGFHNIVIFDHKSKIPISQVLKGFDRRVMVVRCMWDNPVKMKLMNMSIKLSKSIRADWMLYLDADEFLVLPRYKNVVDLLSRYREYDSVSVNWLMFGTNNIIKDPEGFIIDNFTKCSRLLDNHVKSFVRPIEAINAHNPHFFNIYDTSRRIGMNNRIVGVGSPFHSFPVHYLYAPAYIAHYVHQSEETYLNRKVFLPTDDTGAMRGDNRAQVHYLYNDIENLQVKNLYSKRLRGFFDFKEGKVNESKEEIKTQEKKEEQEEIQIQENKEEQEEIKTQEKKEEQEEIELTETEYEQTEQIDFEINYTICENDSKIISN